MNILVITHEGINQIKREVYKMISKNKKNFSKTLNNQINKVNSISINKMNNNFYMPKVSESFSDKENGNIDIFLTEIFPVFNEFQKIYIIKNRKRKPSSLNNNENKAENMKKLIIEHNIINQKIISALKNKSVNFIEDENGKNIIEEKDFLAPTKIVKEYETFFSKEKNIQKITLYDKNLSTYFKKEE